MMKFIAVGAAVIAIGVAGAGCGVSTGSDSATAGTTTTHEAPTQNERIAKSFAETGGGKYLANVCNDMQKIGRQSTERIVSRVLGETILKQGGDVSEVTDLLLDRC